jgi:hypothetical protein
MECKQSVDSEVPVWIWDPSAVFAAWRKLYGTDDCCSSVTLDDIVEEFKQLPVVDLHSVVLGDDDTRPEWVDVALEVQNLRYFVPRGQRGSDAWQCLARLG